MYIIKTIFNNNVVLVKDELKAEYVLMGKGLGFSASSGEIVDNNKIEKKFLMDLSIIESDGGYFETIKLIVDKSEAFLNRELNDYIFYSLADHIDYAIERLEKNIIFRSPIQWEIKKAYPEEYAAAKKALSIINDTLNVELPEEEITFISLHIINASNDIGDFDELFDELNIINDILRIVRMHFKIDIDTNNANYERFVTHLKFFLHRLRNNEQLEVVNEEFFISAVDQWPDIYDCVIKINKLIMLNKKQKINNEETFYLMLHINRLINRKGEKL